MENTTVLVSFTVRDLQAEYGLKSRQAVYDRLKALDIGSVKQGSQSLIRAEDKERLDQLNDYLQVPGRTLAGFLGERNGTTLAPVTPALTAISSPAPQPPQTQLALTDLTQLIKAISPSDPLAHLEKLERAVEMEWVLTSAEVRSLIGIKPSGKSFSRGSFTFTRTGKVGNQSGWRISKTMIDNMPTGQVDSIQ